MAVVRRFALSLIRAKQRSRCVKTRRKKKQAGTPRISVQSAPWSNSVKPGLSAVPREGPPVGDLGCKDATYIYCARFEVRVATFLIAPHQGRSREMAL